MLEQLSTWLGESYLNSVFSDTTHLGTWLIIPLSQTIHILGVSIVMISVGMMNLKLLGVCVTRQSFSQLSRQLAPWMWGALVVLFITGALQTIAEPTRELMNFTFRVKMIFLLITLAITVVFLFQVKKDPDFWNRSPEHRKVARLLAAFSFALWIGIAAAGRLIAYTGAIQEF